jgi:hypothetical protein
MRLWVIGAAALVSACGGMSNEQEAAIVENAVASAEAAAENATAFGEAAEKAKSAPNRDAWVGKWIGVEGLVLTIEKDPGGSLGRYRLANKWSLDDEASGTFDGVATAKGIAFNRPDGAKELVASDGNATGLKYLAGKKDCLTVAPGEGYCRD